MSTQVPENDFRAIFEERVLRVTNQQISEALNGFSPRPAGAFLLD